VRATSAKIVFSPVVTIQSSSVAVLRYTSPPMENSGRSPIGKVNPAS
jgi:hypothetical protein